MSNRILKWFPLVPLLSILCASTLCAQVIPGSSSISLDYLAPLAAANASLRLNEASEARRWLDSIPVEARTWEWRLLDARADSSIDLYATNGWTPIRIDLSPDKSQLAVAGSDGMVRIFSVNPMAVVKEWAVSNQTLYAARFSPDGTQLAVCARDGQLSVWNIASASQVWSMKSGGEGLADVAFHPKGKQLLFCSWYRGSETVKGIVSTWDSTTGDLNWKTDFGVKPIVAARYSPDGNHFAVGTWDAQIGIWKTNSPDAPQVLDFSDRSQYSAIDDIAFSPDGKKLAAATKNGAPRIWTLDRSQPPIDLFGHTNAVFSICFSPDSQSLLSGGSDGVISVWDIANRNQSYRFFGHTNRIGSIVTDARTQKVYSASSDQTLRTWELGDANSYSSPSASKYPYGMVVVDQDQLLVSGGLSESVVSVWNADNKKLVREFPGTKGGVNFLGDNGTDWIVGGNWNGELIVWDFKTGAVIRNFGSKETGGIQQCKLSNDSRWVVAATNKKQVAVWDAQTGELKKLIPFDEGCSSVDFSADGRSLVVGDTQGKVHWFSTEDWNETWNCKVGKSTVFAVRLSHSGKWLVAGDDSGKISIVDTTEHRVMHTSQAHSERIWTLDISPDDRRIVSGSADRRVKIWDPISGVSLLTLADFPEIVYTVRFSKDGKSLYVNCPGAQIFRIRAD